MTTATMRDVRPLISSVPPGWPSAGIVDARAFYIGDSPTAHALTHARPNLVRAACGITAPVVETDRPRASWAGFGTTCPTCLARENQ